MKAEQPLICDVMHSPEECMLKVAETINRAHKETSGVCVVLENVAGGVRYQALPLRHALLTLTAPWHCGDAPQDAYPSTSCRQHAGSPLSQFIPSGVQRQLTIMCSGTARMSECQ